jgi:hypothetical protein
MACCPAHADETPSLSISIGDGGRVLLHCHAGCAVEDVVRAVGMTMAMLMPQSGFGAVAPKTAPKVYATRDLAVATVAGAVGGTVEAIYDYLLADSTIAFSVVRVKTASGKTFRPIRPAGTGWRIGDPDGLLPLFNLPSISQAPEVVVVEGEKCALVGAELGAVTTTSAHGSLSASKTDWTPLAGKTVILMPDNDSSGMQYVAEVASILRGLAPPAKLRLLALPDLPKGGDIVDWRNAKLTAGLQHQDLAEEFARLLDGAEPEPSFASSASFARGGDTSKWAPPQAILDRVVLPPFPIERTFPSYLSRLRDFVLAAAMTYQVPVDAVAMLLLPVLALPLSKRFEVEPMRGWREQLSIYVVVLLPSGERKTAIIRCLLDPIYAWQRDRATGLDATIAHFDNEIFIVGEKLKNARRLTARGKTASDNQDDLARQLHDLEQEKPRPPRLIATEGTSEAIALMLVQNAERGMVAAAEGDALDVMLGRYSGSPNFGVWLSGHSGDAVDSIRRGRSNDHLVHPALQVALCVQPEAALDLIGSRAAEGRGLLARLFFSLPESKVGYRLLTPPAMPVELNDYYGTQIQRHLDFPIQVEPSLIQLTPEAGKLLLHFREQNEIDLRPEGALSLARAWGSKLPGGLVRIAGVFSAFANRQDIDAETMQCALQFAPYLTGHYEHIASIAGADQHVDVARRIDRWLLKKGLRTFSRRDAFTALRSARINEVGDIDGALELLQTKTRIRQLPADPNPKPGRPAGPVFEVNPALLKSGAAPSTQNAQNAQNSEGAA